MNATSLTAQHVEEFRQQGFLILRGAGLAQLTRFRRLAEQERRQPSEPWELEAKLGYPGAPASTEQPGGDTVRRLLQATDRQPEWQQWATSNLVGQWVRALTKSDKVYLNPNHHNCLMTKSPQYSSDTGWHQDIRYWHFTQPELVSVWFALGEESSANGGLVVIPGSHRAQFSPQQFDEHRFFLDNEHNRPWLDSAEAIHLDAGDVLLFDARLLHRASRNHTDQTKLSLVFTYRAEGNPPLTGTRSARFPELLVD